MSRPRIASCASKKFSSALTNDQNGNDEAYRSSLRTQIREAYGRVVYTQTTHLKEIDTLQLKSRQIKNLQIVLSAISTGGILSSVFNNGVFLKIASASISTLLLVLTLYLRSIDLEENIKRHQDTADKLWDLREDYVSLLTDFALLSNQEIRKRRDKLQLSVSKVYHDALKTDSKSYKLAQRALKSDDEQFFTREEINHILPENLRI